MRVSQIVSLDKRNGDYLVCFKAISGRLAARWHPEDKWPMLHVGQCLDAELDVDADLIYGETARPGEIGKLGTDHDESSVKIWGCVEGQDEDGMTYVRVARDFILMLDAMDEGLEGSWVELTFPIDKVKMVITGM